MDAADNRRDDKIEKMSETLIRIDERMKTLQMSVESLKDEYVKKEEFRPIQESHSNIRKLFWGGMTSAVGALAVSVVTLYNRLV